MVVLRHPQGAKSRLTPLQEVELLAWYKARRALGNDKTKARELGISPSALQAVLKRLRRHNGMTVRRRASNGLG